MPIAWHMIINAAPVWGGMLGYPLQGPGGVKVHFDGHLADLEAPTLLAPHSGDETLHT